MTSIPSCISCRHMKRDFPLLGEPRCTHPKVTVEEWDNDIIARAAVHGRPPPRYTIACHIARGDRFALTEAGEEALVEHRCGTQGQYWEAR